jgi:4'-phosphopantetheinyl transferase
LGGDHVGVDIERIRAVASQEGLARKYYTQREQQELASLPTQESLERFFAFWTRKEAFVKLLGTGLQGELSSIDVREVTAEGGEVARGDGRDRCWLSDIKVPKEFRAAVAVAHRPHTVATYRLATGDY